MRSAMLDAALVLLVDASAFMVGVNRIPSARCSSAMVESWYDAKMAADGEAVTARRPSAGNKPPTTPNWQRRLRGGRTR